MLIYFFVGNSSITLILINCTWEVLIFVREFMKRIFAHKKEPEIKSNDQPLVKPLPAYESPLKDSYNNSSSLSKENTK